MLHPIDAVKNSSAGKITLENTIRILVSDAKSKEKVECPVVPGPEKFMVPSDCYKECEYHKRMSKEDPDYSAIGTYLK